jgi:hypothetical protein
MQLVEQRAQRYESENVDRDWAPRAEAEILEKVSQTGVQVLDLRVECRTSICRLELLERANERSISMPIAIALLQVADLQPSFPRQIDSTAGTRATVSYLARKEARRKSDLGATRSVTLGSPRKAARRKK